MSNPLVTSKQSYPRRANVGSWRMRAKIYRWYEELERIELLAEQGLSEEELAQCHAELNRIEAEARRVHVPLPFAAQAYDLRLHTRLVREDLTSSGDDRG